VVGPGELRIHRNEIVDAVHLDAVAGEVDDGPVGIGRPVAELAKNAAAPPRITIKIASPASSLMLEACLQWNYEF
jgi:hypothetical protein